MAVFSYRSQKTSIYGKKIAEPLGYFIERVLSIFLAANFFLITAEGWGEKEICTKGAVDGQK